MFMYSRFPFRNGIKQFLLCYLQFDDGFDEQPGEFSHDMTKVRRISGSCSNYNNNNNNNNNNNTNSNSPFIIIITVFVFFFFIIFLLSFPNLLHHNSSPSSDSSSPPLIPPLSLTLTLHPLSLARSLPPYLSLSISPSLSLFLSLLSEHNVVYST